MKINNHFVAAKKLATLLDTKFNILGIKFGIDPVLDLLPGVGSVIGGITSLYIFWIATKLSVPGKVYFKMLVNILFDLILGEIPIIGLVLDIFYKSNIRNLKILEKYLKPDFIEGKIID